MLHVFIGLIVLFVIMVLTWKGKFNETYSTPVEVGGLYWHLVDLIWIYLFPLLYLIG
jgi:cytochrome c oxidase subunit 3